jgi:hypothetical protein
MTFEEWWNSYVKAATFEEVWEAGIREGIDRMYTLYDICPECKLPNGQHKMDCTRG